MEGVPDSTDTSMCDSHFLLPLSQICRFLTVVFFTHLLCFCAGDNQVHLHVCPK